MMRMLRIYNSLSGSVEKFMPISGKTVRLYTCGPTVYARPHIGNYRTYVFEDVVKRWLIHKGYRVRHVMNITDFDNTIMKEARKTGVPRKEMVKKYERIFRHELSALGALPADEYPHASEFAGRMAGMALRLLEKGKAYDDGTGKIFFDISKFRTYGLLAGKKIKGGKKVTKEEFRPGEAGDFLLLKPCKRNGDGCFDTKAGKASPQWNIQCAAMCTHHLGEQIDISMGGSDNRFSHHENTRAIAESLSGKQYAKYWIHVRHLILDGKKMSKSKGNVVRLPDLERKGFSADEIRFILLSAHYRRRLNFTWEYAKKTKARLAKMRKNAAKIKRAAGSKRKAGADRKFSRLLSDAKKDFENAMDDDLDAPRAIERVETFLAGCAKLAESKRLPSADARIAIALLGGFASALGLEF